MLSILSTSHRSSLQGVADDGAEAQAAMTKCKVHRIKHTGRSQQQQGGMHSSGIILGGWPVGCA